MRTRTDDARWRIWLAGIRKRNPGEILYVEQADDDEGESTTTPVDLSDLREDAPPPPGVSVFAHVAERDEPYVFHPAPTAATGKGLVKGELRELLKAANAGQSRYIELVQPTLTMYRDDNTRLLERTRELEGEIRRLQKVIADANAKTVDERMEERREAREHEIIHKHLLPRLERVMKTIEGNASVAAIAQDLGVLMQGVGEDVRAQIVAVDPERAFRVLGALEAAAAAGGR